MKFNGGMPASFGALARRAPAVWTNDRYAFVATSRAHALDLCAAYNGGIYPGDGALWFEMHPSEPITIDEGKGPITKPAGKWAEERGTGYLCSVED